MERVGMVGVSVIQVKQLLEIYSSSQPISDTPAEFRDLTPSEIEEKLRQSIENHNRKYEIHNQLTYGTLNKEIKTQFGKGRQEMTIDELKRVWAWIKEKYPI